jgi:hypothetical protein
MFGNSANHHDILRPAGDEFARPHNTYQPTTRAAIMTRRG